MTGPREGEQDDGPARGSKTSAAAEAPGRTTTEGGPPGTPPGDPPSARVCRRQCQRVAMPSPTRPNAKPIARFHERMPGIG